MPSHNPTADRHHPPERNGHFEFRGGGLAETGFTAGRLDRLGCLHSANALTGEQATEQDMRQRWFPRTEVERMLLGGEITEGPTLAAYLLLTLRERSAQ